MARKKTETVSQPAPTIVVQPDGKKVSHIFSAQFDALALAMYENTLPEADKAKLSVQDINSMTIYVRHGILQLDMPANGIELNDVQKKVRELWFTDRTEDAIREQVLGPERYQYWKQTGSVEPPPKKEEEASSSPASENKGEAASTINVEINASDGNNGQEENTMFNQQNVNGQQAQPNNQTPNQQQNGSNFISDAIGAVDNFTNHWYGKAAIAGAAAAGTYYLMNKAQNSDPDYSSAGDDAMAEFGGNFF
mgnify:CR=1 FL=1